MRGVPTLARALRPAASSLLRPTSTTSVLLPRLVRAHTHTSTLPIPPTLQSKNKKKKINPLSLKRLHITVDGQIYPYDSLFLRDACRCAACIHPSTQQKLFQTTDIPYEVRPQTFEARKDGSVRIVWKNDLVTPQNPTGDKHESVYDLEFLRRYSSLRNRVRARFNDQRQILWDRKTMEKDVLFVEYEDYMKSDDALFKAVKQLSLYGLMFIKGIPEGMSDAVEGMAERIGNLKNTFYGKTWDVKSIKDSKNIA